MKTKFKEIAIYFIITFVVTFAVAAIVTYLWNLIAHGSSAFDWANSFRLAITFAIVIPFVMKVQERVKKQK